MGANGEVGSTYNLPFMAPIYAKMLAALKVHEVMLWSCYSCVFQAGNIPEALQHQMRSVELVNLLHVYGDGALKVLVYTNITGL